MFPTRLLALDSDETVARREEPKVALGDVHNTFGRLNIIGLGYCSATLVGERVVLTAAHCLYDVKDSEWVKPHQLVFLSGYRLGHAVASSPAESFVISPKFDAKKWSVYSNIVNDWAIVVLKKNIGLKVGFLSISPLKSSDVNFLIHSKMHLLLAGYPIGLAHVGGVNTSCHVSSIFVGAFSLNQSCKLYEGDSGGPLLLPRDGKLSVMGITSSIVYTRGQFHYMSVPILENSGIMKLLGSLVGSTAVVAS